MEMALKLLRILQSVRCTSRVQQLLVCTSQSTIVVLGHRFER
jgi:hypothetical protein